MWVRGRTWWILPGDAKGGRKSILCAMLPSMASLLGGSGRIPGSARRVGSLVPVFVSALAIAGIGAAAPPRIPDLPKVSGAFRAAQAEFEAARAAERRALEAWRAADQEKVEALGRYRDAFDARLGRYRELEDELAAADEAWRRAEAELGHRIREEERLRPAIRQTQQKTRAAVAAREAHEAASRARREAERLAEAAEAAKTRAEEAKSRFGTTGGAEGTAELARAQVRAAVAHRDLGEARKRALEAFRKLGRAAVEFTPPYLRSVKMMAGGGLQYHGEWRPESPEEEKRRRAPADRRIAELESQLAELGDRIEQARETRLALVNEMRPLTEEVLASTAAEGWARMGRVAGPALIEGAGVLVEAMFPPGAAWKLVAPSYSGVGSGAEFVDGVVKVSGAFVSKSGAAYAGERFGETVPIDDIVFGDAIEFGMASGPVFDDLALKAFHRSVYAGHKMVSIQNALKYAVPTTALKVAAERYFDYKLTVAQNRTFMALSRLAVLDRLFLEARGAYREMMEAQVRIQLALAAAEHRRDTVRTPVRFEKLRDQPLDYDSLPILPGDRPVPVRLELAFSQSLSVPPVVDFGRQAIPAPVRDESDERSWSLAFELTGLPRDLRRLEMAVDVGPGNQPFPALDADPATLTTLAAKTLAWDGLEAGPDRRHGLSVSPSRIASHLELLERLRIEAAADAEVRREEPERIAREFAGKVVEDFAPLTDPALDGERVRLKISLSPGGSRLPEAIDAFQTWRRHRTQDWASTIGWPYRGVLLISEALQNRFRVVLVETGLELLRIRTEVGRSMSADPEYRRLVQRLDRPAGDTEAERTRDRAASEEGLGKLESAYVDRMNLRVQDLGSRLVSRRREQLAAGSRWLEVLKELGFPEWATWLRRQLVMVYGFDIGTWSAGKLTEVFGKELPIDRRTLVQQTLGTTTIRLPVRIARDASASILPVLRGPEAHDLLPSWR